jgi:LysR family transcriptional regulator, low CO2-responsive transcriptional regulator
MNNAPPPGRLPARIGTFRQLEILLRVAECGGIAAAAARLHLSQPSVSMQLRKLSDSVGLPLYEVLGRRVHLTEAGHTTVRHAREVFDCLARLEMALNQLQGMQAGHLSLGVVSSAEYFIPHLLGPFYRRYPQIEVTLHVGNRAQLSERLRNNLDDLYFFGHPPDDDGAEAVAVGPNHLIVVAPRTHPLAARKRLRWSDVAGEQFIVREEGAGTRAETEAHLQRLGLRLTHKMTIASNEGIKHAVLARMGLAIIPTLTLDEGDQQELVALPVAGFPISGHWHLVSRAGKTFSVVAETFRDYVLTEGRTMLREALAYWERHHRPKLPTR